MKRLFAIFLVIFAQSMSHAAFGEGEEASAVETQPYVELQPEFIVNYGAGTKVRYLKTAISLRVENTAAEASVNHHSDAIRHEIILQLSQQSSEDILNAENKSKLRKDIVNALQKVLKEETGMKLVNDLLFTEWIVQR